MSTTTQPAATAFAGGATQGPPPDDRLHHLETPPPLRRLITILRPDRGDIRTIVLFALVVAVLGLAVPLTTNALVGFTAFGGLLQPLLILGVILAAASLAGGLIRVAQLHVLEVLQRRLAARLVLRYSERLPRARFAGAHGRPVSFATRLLEVFSMQKALAGLLLDGINVVLTAAAGLVLLAFYHPLLLGFAGLLVTLLAVIVFLPAGRAVRTAVAESHAKYDVIDRLQQLADGSAGTPPGARTGAADAEVLDRLTDYLDCRRRHFRVVMTQHVGAVTLQAFSGTALLIFGGQLVLDNQLTLGQLVAAELVVGLFAAGVGKLSKHLEAWYHLLAAAEKIGTVEDLPLVDAHPDPDAPHGAEPAGGDGAAPPIAAVVTSVAAGASGHAKGGHR